MSADRAWPQRPLGAAAIALAIGALAAFLFRSAPVLAPPAPCAALLELGAVAIARVAPSAAVGPLWLLLNRVLLIVALGSFALLARRASGRWWMAAAITVAFGGLTVFDPRYAPFDAAATAVAAWTVHALIARADVHGRRPRLLVVWTGLALTAAISPRLALPLALVGLLSARPFETSSSTALRWGGPLAVAAAFVGAVYAIVAFVPSAPPGSGAWTARACFLPRPFDSSWRGIWDAARAPIASAGAYAGALVALGAFGARTRVIHREVWPAVGYAALPLLMAAWSPGESAARFLAPAIVGTWLLVAIGLADLVAACRSGLGGRLAAVVLVLLVPVLRVAAHVRTPADGPPSAGHETVSPSTLAATLRTLPAGSTLVAEDATTDVALRSLSPAERGPALRMVDATLAAVGNAVADRTTRVFAMPAAQAYLQSRGFGPKENGLVPAPGFVEIAQLGGCQQLTNVWQDVPELERSSAFALVAQNGSEAGPVVLYFTAPILMGPGPVGWPPGTTRGFNVAVYLRENADLARRLDRDMQADEVPPASAAAIRDAVSVTRLELWRTPASPLVLNLTLGVAPTLAAGHIVPPTNHSRITVCPASVATIAPLAFVTH